MTGLLLINPKDLKMLDHAADVTDVEYGEPWVGFEEVRDEKIRIRILPHLTTKLKV